MKYKQIKIIRTSAQTQTFVKNLLDRQKAKCPECNSSNTNWCYNYTKAKFFGGIKLVDKYYCFDCGCSWESW